MTKRIIEYRDKAILKSRLVCQRKNTAEVLENFHLPPVLTTNWSRHNGYRILGAPAPTKGKVGDAMGKTIYIVLTDTGTLLSKTIGMYTRKDLNHASIAFDEQLTEMYSFGRKYNA